MRRYDDPVEVRRGPERPGEDTAWDSGRDSQTPAQFLWRGRLWKVSAVVAHWVETGPWWQSRNARAVLGDDLEESAEGRTGVLGGSLGAEREVWRVEAGRGMAAAGAATNGAAENAGRGVFDLCFDWDDGSWRLTRCLD